MAHKRSHEDVSHRDGRHSKTPKTKHRSSSDKSSQQSPVTKPPYQSKISELDKRLPVKASPGGPVPSLNTAKHSMTVTAKSSELPLLPPISPSLSEAPFTHASVANEKYGSGLTYDRLEFLGDAYLEVIATRLLYSRFPDLAIGRLSALRERLVRNSTLAEFAFGYGFQKRIKVDSAQGKRFMDTEAGVGNDKKKKSGQAHTPEKMMADVFEAYVAAVILSDDANGFAIAEQWLTNLWVDMLLDAEHDSTLEKVQNRKDELARHVGGMEIKLDYQVDNNAMANIKAGNPQQPKIVAVYLTGWGYVKTKLGQGQGLSVKEAGMRAAADALDNNRELIAEISAIKSKSDQERRERLAKERGLDGPHQLSKKEQTPLNGS